MLTIKTRRLNDKALLPKRGTPQSAGYDLYSLEEVTIPEGESKFINTGLSIEIPDGYFGAIYARSGLACKQGLRPANCVGVIDSDYRGEVMVCLTNDSSEVRTIPAGTRVAQLVIQKYEEISFVTAEELSETERGTDGFGSTDPKQDTMSWNIQ